MIPDNDRNEELQILSVMLIIALVAGAVIFPWTERDAAGMAAAGYGNLSWCYDNDGLNFYTKSYVNYGIGNSSITVFDYCRNVSSNWVVERICINNTLGNYDYYCANGCNNGACKRVIGIIRNDTTTR